MRLLCILCLFSCSIFKSNSIQKQESEIKNTELKSTHITYRKRTVTERSLIDISAGKSKYGLLSDLIFTSLDDEHITGSSFDKKKATLKFNISKEQGTKYINQQLRIYNNEKQPENDRAEALHKVGLLFAHPFFEENNETRTLYYFNLIKKEFSNYYRIKEIESYLEKQKSSEH